MSPSVAKQRCPLGLSSCVFGSWRDGRGCGRVGLSSARAVHGPGLGGPSVPRNDGVEAGVERLVVLEAAGTSQQARNAQRQAPSQRCAAPFGSGFSAAGADEPDDLLSMGEPLAAPESEPRRLAVQ